MSYPISIICTLILCFAAQALALRSIGGRTLKSESNFFSSVGRIQAGMRGDSRVMMLGSSITGRLPDRAQGFDGFANLGCDGGSAVDVLRAMHEGRLPSAPVVLVEANALAVALKGQSEVASAMKRPWFLVGSKVPALSAYARPSAFFYSMLLARRIGGQGDTEDENLGAETLPALPDATWRDLDVGPVEGDMAIELASRIEDLRERGVRVIVVWLPPARPENEPPPAWIRRMVGRSGAEWWDLAAAARPERVRLTDNVHMDAASAVRTVRSLRIGLAGSR